MVSLKYSYKVFYKDKKSCFLENQTKKMNLCYCVNIFNLSFLKLILILSALLCIPGYNCLQASKTHVDLFFETKENLPVNSLIGKIKIPDLYLYQNLTQSPPYLILPVNNQKNSLCNIDTDLDIDQHTSDIKNAVPLDREKCALYKFMAISFKGISFQISINVMDINDNAPFFTIPHINIRLPENSKPNEVKRTLPFATDLDSGIFGLQTYEIKSGNENNTFKLLIHKENDDILYLDLQVNKELDRELINNYNLIIEALDGGNPPLKATLKVNIDIDDVNDNKPVFENSINFVNLPNNVTVGSKILKVKATDADIGSNAKITFFLQESSNTLKQLNKNYLGKGMFEIDNKGWVYLVHPLTNLPKSLQKYELIVFARDSGEIPLETSALIIINLPYKNHLLMPKINIFLLTENGLPRINETAKIGEIVAKITISNVKDENLYNKYYSDKKTTDYKLILNGNENKFSLNFIDSNSYLLIINNTLDREEKDKYVLNILTYHEKKPWLNATEILELKIIDSNDNKPYFEQPISKISLSQYQDLNTVVYKFEAQDKDLPLTNKMSYKINLNLTSKEALDWFSLNSSSGELVVKKLIDCRLNSNPLIVVDINDGLNQGQNKSLIINLQSDDNHEPIFEKSFYNITLKENENTGYSFFKVIATDKDCGLNSTINFAFLDTSKSNFELKNNISVFSINKNTGELSLNEQLDFETKIFYELILIATNLNGKNSTSILHVYIEDVNDNKPEFLTINYQVNVPENIVPLTDDHSGQPAPILLVKAFDHDFSSSFNSLKYSIISGNEETSFEIDEQNGKLYLLKPLSSVRPLYVLNISVQDFDGLKSDNNAVVKIYVLHSGYQQTYLQFTNTLYNFNLVENSLPGLKIGKLNVFKFNSNDKNAFVNMYQIKNSSHSLIDPYLLEYKIYSGNLNNSFVIDTQTGELSLIDRKSSFPDYEKVQNILINVQCRFSSYNNEYTYAYSQVYINVVNLNDNTPMFYNDLNIISIKQNSDIKKPIYAVKAIDADAGLFGRLRYYFKTLSQDNLETTNSNGPFLINKLSGEIFINDNFSLSKSYELIVICIDGGGRTSEMQSKISLVETNKNIPYFIDPSTNRKIESLNLQVYENIELDEIIYKFLAYNYKDSTVIFSIISQKVLLVNKSDYETMTSNCFKVSLIDGNLKVNCNLDRETAISYELIVQIKNQDDLQNTISVKISLLDINDNFPVFEKNEFRFQLSEDSIIGTKVGQIFAHDLDQDLNGTIFFSLLKKNSENFFSLNSTTGELFLNQKLDRECKDRYVLKVSVHDLGEKIQLNNEQFASIIVDILDVNDNKPVFLDYNVSISDYLKQQCNLKYDKLPVKNNFEYFELDINKPLPLSVTKVRAFDSDLGDNSTVLYSIKYVYEENDKDNSIIKNQFSINSEGLIECKTKLESNLSFKLGIEAKDSKGLISEEIKWIKIKTLKIETKNITKNSNVVFISVENIKKGQLIGRKINLKDFELYKYLNSSLLHEDNCFANRFFIDSFYDDLYLPFTININENEIQIVSLINFIKSETFSFSIYLNLNNCALSLTNKSEIKKDNFISLIEFEIELKQKIKKNLFFDCLKEKLKNTEFGENLLKVNLDLNQDLFYEKSLDVYNFKSSLCDTNDVKFIISDIKNSSENKQFINQFKINNDLMLQYIPKENLVLTDQEFLLNIQAFDILNNLNDNLLMNIFFNKKNEVNVDKLKIKCSSFNCNTISIELTENCCKKNEIIHHVSLNYDLYDLQNYKVIFNFDNNSSTYEIFSIDSNGLIKLNQSFDYETSSYHELKIQISLYKINEKKLLKRLFTTLKISVIDVNDESPVFENIKQIELSENTPIGFLISHLKATDRDVFDTELTYLIPDGYSNKKYFDLNSKTGELRTKSLFDREKISLFSLPIFVFDNDYLHNDQTLLNIKITDINDNKPFFKQNEISITIPENISKGSNIYTFIANDEDESSILNYKLEYESSCNQLEKIFSLNSETGKLFVDSIVDYETCSFYKLKITVTDGQFSSSCNLLLKIKDINDNKPVFEKKLYELYYDLDRLERKSFKNHDLIFYELLVVKANDVDTFPILSYSIDLEKNDGKYFTLNSTSGQLSINKEVLSVLIKEKLNKSLNKDTKTIKIRLDLNVHDITSYNVLNDSCTIEIVFDKALFEGLIENIDTSNKDYIKFKEYPTVFELDFQNKKTYKVLIDNQSSIINLRFEIKDETSDFEEYFSFDKYKCEFTLKKPINKNLEFFVKASSDSSEESLNLIKFKVKNLTNEILNETKISKVNFELNLEENTEIGHSLILLEESLEVIKNETYQYNVIFSSANFSWFSLNSKNGLLTTNIKFDYEKHPEIIELICLAKLLNQQPGSLIFISLKINLINVNEFSPIFNHQYLVIPQIESSPKETLVYKLGSIDLDTIKNNKSRLDYGLTYHIVEGNHDNAFKISDNLLLTNLALDREIHESYHLKIIVNDQSIHHQTLQSFKSKTKPHMLKYILIDIVVVDKNDNRPFFSFNQELSFFEDTNSIGDTIGFINANDVDVYPNLKYMFSNKSSSNQNEIFDIDLFTGEIRLKKNLKTQKYIKNSYKNNILKSFNLSIVADDNDHQTETSVSIILKESSIYKQSPVFTQETYYLELIKSELRCVSINCPLYQIKTKLFVQEESKIKVQFKLLKKGNRHFYIDSNEGIIYYNQTSFESELPKNHLFKLIVQSFYTFENNRPINNLKSTSSLIINIKPIDNSENYLKDLNRIINIDIESYNYGDIIYRLPIDQNNDYELSNVDDESFAIVKKNLLIILKKPSKTETTLQIKRKNIKANYDLLTINIRYPLLLKKKTNQILEKSLFKMSLEEQTLVGHKISLKIKNSSKAVFSILAGNKNDQFSIDSKTGNLHLNKILNCKITNKFNLLITAKNEYDFEFAIVHITVLSTPQPHITLPIFPMTNYHAVIKENVPINTKVIRIQYQEEIMKNKGYVIVLSDNNSNLPFKFENETGYIVTTSEIDSEKLFNQDLSSSNVLNFKVGVQLIDPNSYLKPLHNESSHLFNLYPKMNNQIFFNSLLNFVSVEIKIINQDEFYPTFEKDTYNFKTNLLPVSPNISIVGQVHAEDKDYGLDGVVLYSIKEIYPNWTKDSFSIDINTGIISFNKNKFQHSYNVNKDFHSSFNLPSNTEIKVIGKSPKLNSLTSFTVVIVSMVYETKPETILTKKSSSKQKSFSNQEANIDFIKVKENNNLLDINLNFNNLNRINTMNKNNLAPVHETNNYHLKPTLTKQQTNKNENEGFIGQRKLIKQNVIHVFGVVVSLLALLLVLVIFSVILLLRIKNFNQKNKSCNAFNSTNDLDFDSNGMTKSISCLINRNFENKLESNKDQTNKFKQTDLMSKMVLQRNSIIYQDQNKILNHSPNVSKNFIYMQNQNDLLNKNNSLINSNASLISNQNDNISNCNTSLTIVHSHENSETKSIGDYQVIEINSNNYSSSNQENRNEKISRRSHVDNNDKLNKIQKRSLPVPNTHKKLDKKNRPLPANPPDLVKNNETDYDEVKEDQLYINKIDFNLSRKKIYSNEYINSNDISLNQNHNYETISQTYDKIENMQNWSPAYYPVTDVLNEIVKNKNSKRINSHFYSNKNINSVNY